MKKILSFILGLFIISSLIAQEEPPEEEKAQKLQKGKMLLMELFSDTWQSEQAGVSFKTINRGAGIYSLREKNLGKGKFGIALGVGVGTHNLYSNGILINEVDTSGISTGKTVFSKIPDSIDYGVNKFTVAYFDVPFEIRFHPKGKLKMAAGFKTGVLIQSHIKYSGKELSGSGEDIKMKYYKINNLAAMRYGITGRIGFKYVSLSFFYSLSNVFEKDKGPELCPVSVGLTFTPF